MKLRDEIGDLASAFGGMAADLKSHQDKLLSYGRGLESIVSERTAELEHEKANLEIRVAERTAQLNAANAELKVQATERLPRDPAPSIPSVSREKSQNAGRTAAQRSRSRPADRTASTQA